MTILILTLLGDDRPGLVSAVSARIGAHGGSWERSRLSRLEGKFAGIAVVSVPDLAVDTLLAELAAIDVALSITCERAHEPATHPPDQAVTVEDRHVRRDTTYADSRTWLVARGSWLVDAYHTVGDRQVRPGRAPGDGC